MSNHESQITNIFHKKTFSWIVVILGSALTALPMFIVYKSITGSFLPTIFLQLESDSIYYLTQVQKVLQGHATLGNPYILEYRDAAFPGLKLAIYLAALPGFFGLSINMIYAVNAVLFSILTGAVLYALSLRITDNAPRISAAIAILGTASLHNLLIRPAIMQTVYPVFGLYMLAFLSVLTRPKKIAGYVALGATAVLSFYLYPHLWMQEFTALGLLFLMSLLQKKMLIIRNLFWMGIGVIVLCLPQIITTIHLFTEPMALLINERSGLVETHIVLPLTILNNKYTIVTLVALLALRCKRCLRAEEVLLVLLTSSVLIAATSNVVTGKLMDFHSHPWRLSLMVLIVGIGVFWQIAKRAHQNIEKWGAATLFLLLLATTLNRTVIRANAYSYIPKNEEVRLLHEKIKEYQEVMIQLDANGIHDSVILSNKFLSFIIPLYTDNTVLFTVRSNLHVLPKDELLERFLTQNIDHISKEFLLGHVDHFAGLGYIEQALYKNAYANEEDNIAPIDLMGGDSYLQTALELGRDIDRNYEEYLAKFQVRYIVNDTEDALTIRIPKNTSILFKNERFTVYEMY